MSDKKVIEAGLILAFVFLAGYVAFYMAWSLYAIAKSRRERKKKTQGLPPQGGSGLRPKPPNDGSGTKPLVKMMARPETRTEQTRRLQKFVLDKYPNATSGEVVSGKGKQFGANWFVMSDFPNGIMLAHGNTNEDNAWVSAAVAIMDKQDERIVPD